MKWKPEIYKGRLGKPTYYNPAKLPAGDELRFEDGEVEQSSSGGVVVKLITNKQREYKKQIAQTLGNIVDAVFQEYGIERDGNLEDEWRRLACALMLAHVPAFNLVTDRPKRRGAPIKRTLAKYAEVFEAVTSARSEIAAKRKCNIKSVSIKDAVKGAIKRNPNKWRGRKGPVSVASLEVRFYQSKSKIGPGPVTALELLLGLR